MTLDKFIGLPYREGARGPDAYDCYGLVAAVIRATRGVDIPDWHPSSSEPQSSSRAISAALRGEVYGGRSRLVSVPENLDIVIAGSVIRPHHVGVFIDGGVLHASRAFGSAWHRLSQFATMYPKTEYYRWRP